MELPVLSLLRYSGRCLLLLATLASSLHNGVRGQSENTNLTFMLVISYGEFGFNSSGGLPAAEMALEDINSDPDMLPGYNLVYDRIRNSQVNIPVCTYCTCTCIKYMTLCAWYNCRHVHSDLGSVINQQHS